MIETVTGIDAVDEIAGVPGVDVIFAASTDIGSFSGKRQGDPEYEALITRIHDGVLAAGRQLGGPQGWMDRDDFTFFQGPSATALIRLGARTSLATERSGTAPIEGAAPRR